MHQSIFYNQGDNVNDTGNIAFTRSKVNYYNTSKQMNEFELEK